MQSPRGEAAEGKRGRGHRQQCGEGEARAFAAASSAGATPRWSKGPRRSAKSVEAERQLTQWPCPSSERTCRERRRGQRLKGAATHASAAAAWAHQLALIRRPNLDGPVLRARVQEPLAAPAQAGDRVGVPAERAGAPPAHALPQPDRPVLGGGGEPTLGQSRSDLGPSPSVGWRQARGARRRDLWEAARDVGPSGRCGLVACSRRRQPSGTAPMRGR